MPKGHKPKAASRSYTIHGTGKKRVQSNHNVELRILRCRGCGAPRDKGSAPFCANCSTIIHEKD